MKFCLIAFSIFLIGESFALGKVSHLLVESLGDGVFQLEDGGKQNPISASTFLPQDTKLSVRPKSGIETLAAGYQFRFGSSTTFECNYESIELYGGSIFIRSRKITNSIKIIGPEVTIRLSGAGSCMMEVEPNGGFKFVGLLGKLISSIDETTYVNILPGDIVFTNLLEDTFSDKLVVDLDNLLQSSFLLSGFANSNSFLDSLKSVSKSQKLHMEKLWEPLLVVPIILNPSKLSRMLQKNKIANHCKIPQNFPTREGITNYLPHLHCKSS